MSGELLDKLDASVPSKLKEFDAFPKLPSTYKTRSESRGFLTLAVAAAAFFLLLNDVSEFLFGWPTYEFGVDHGRYGHMRVNVDMVVNMPCGYLSVDLRDAIGDRLYLTSAFRRDGTKFDASSATLLKEHAEQQSARDIISQARSTRGFFAFWRKSEPSFKPTYNYEPDGSACRIYGSLLIKKVTANLHVTTLGHGYQTNIHVDHSLMNLSHVITEFSFGPYFPNIVQPLDNSYELSKEPFISYQYFLHIVPTRYTAPRSSPLETNQYSVTHYTRLLEHNRGTPGIFFKFDVDPIRIEINQKTMGFIQFIVRCVGVIGGIFTCMAYTIKVGTKAVEVVTGPDSEGEIASVAAASGVSKGKWRGGSLHARSGSNARVIRQGNSWVVEGSEASYGGSLAGTPTSPYMHGPYSTGGSPYTSPAPGSGGFGPQRHTPSPSPASASLGLGLASPSFGPGSAPASPAPGATTFGSAPPTPGAGYAYFPPTPTVNAAGFPSQPLPGSPHPAAAGGFGQRVAPPPPRSLSQGSNGSIAAKKKDE